MSVVRVKIAKALTAEADATPADPGKRPDEAKLQGAADEVAAIVQAGRRDEGTAEAALESGRLQAKLGRYDEAQKTWELVLALMTDKATLIKMERPEELARPFADAARGYIDRLKYARNGGMAEFEAAEGLRSAGKFAEAVKAYQVVIKKFPASEYAPRSDLHIGDCLVGLRQFPQALDQWRKFIAPLPAGPWRGQAYLRIVDLAIEEAFDLAEASKYIELARAA